MWDGGRCRNRIDEWRKQDGVMGDKIERMKGEGWDK